MFVGSRAPVRNMVQALRTAQRVVSEGLELVVQLYERLSPVLFIFIFFVVLVHS